MDRGIDDPIAYGQKQVDMINADYSYDQLLEGVGFMGENYEKFVELFTAQTSEKYGIDTSTSYFDCTNFYFEIDREYDFRKMSMTTPLQIKMAKRRK